LSHDLFASLGKTEAPPACRKQAGGERGRVVIARIHWGCSVV
jgi:hypothetical protein